MNASGSPIGGSGNPEGEDFLLPNEERVLARLREIVDSYRSETNSDVLEATAKALAADGAEQGPGPLLFRMGGALFRLAPVEAQATAIEIVFIPRDT
jgi:hypothetical protein